MRYYYDEYMPLRILDETEFWKRQEGDHIVVIMETAENLESRFAQALMNMQRMFGDTEAEPVRYMEASNRLHSKPAPGLRSKIMYLMQRPREKVKNSSHS